MSTEKPEVRPEEQELQDEALEEVAGGCQIGDSRIDTYVETYTVPTLTTF